MVLVQRKKEYEIKLLTAISKKKDHMIGFIFIDSTDLGEGNLRPNLDTFEDLSSRMQVAINQ